MNARLTPALILSALLLSPQYGEEWKIDKPETKNLNNQTIDGVSLTKGGFLVVNNSGTSTIKQMQMFWFNPEAGAEFNVNSGTLNLDLSIVNNTRIPNSIKFNIKRGAELNLIGEKNGFQQGLFYGVGTNLDVILNSGAKLNGNIVNDGRSVVSIASDATLVGNMIQTGGSINAQINGSLKGNLVLSGAESSLSSNQTRNKSATITGNIVQDGGSLTGRIRGLTLKGSFMQTGGTSDLAFEDSKLESSTTLINPESATLGFYETELKSISSTGGTAMLILNNSQMEGYLGIDSATIITMQHSAMQDINQTRGDFELNAQGGSVINGTIAGANTRLDLVLADTQVTGSITNFKNDEFNRIAGVTFINANRVTIGGNIYQSNGELAVSLKQTTLQGNLTQVGGKFSQLEATNSTIHHGIFLTEVEEGVFGQEITLSNTKVNNGIHIKNLRSEITGSISDGSVINGGYFQEGRERMELVFKGSSLEGGIQVHDSGRLGIADIKDPKSYMTTLDFTKSSSYRGGVTSNNHSLWLGLSQSKGEGNLIISNSDLYLKGSNESLFVGNLKVQDRSNTYLDFNLTKFQGTIDQVGGRQYADLSETLVTGDYHNIDTNTTLIIREDSQIQNYRQDSGRLNLQLGGNAIIHKNVELNQVETTISNGMVTDRLETIKGDFTQNGGSLTGRLIGLTLDGTYTQNGGRSDVSYEGANFANPTSINQAEHSNITFDHGSSLKDYTINGGRDNTLKLDHDTTLFGNFTLNHAKSKLSVINNSKITGNIISEDEDSELEIEMKNGSSIEGDLIISKGKAGGSFNDTTIGGNLKLTDADSDFHFKNSTIGGNIHIIRGTTKMILEGTKVLGWFLMQERGPKTPTLDLEISNGSSIGRDLVFYETEAFIGGRGDGNILEENLISINSTLTNGGAKYGGTGDPLPLSGLTIKQDLRQQGGTLDLTLTNKSQIQGLTKFNETKKSHLTMNDFSAMHKLEVNKSEDVIVTLNDFSSQSWRGIGAGITLSDSKVIINAFNSSTITSSVNVISSENYLSDTKIYLKNGSTMLGDITQGSGDLLLDLDQSVMKGAITINRLKAQINANHQSQIEIKITATNTQTNIDLNNQSTMTADIVSTSSTIQVVANNRSTLSGNITHTYFTKSDPTLIMQFNGGSTLNNSKMELNGSAKITANDSVINSDSIHLSTGKFEMMLNHSSGLIKSLDTAGSNLIDIYTTNSSNSTIETLKISDSATLRLRAENNARIAGNLLMSNSSIASLISLNNATIAFDITPTQNADLDITLRGGKLQGRVIQDEPLLGNAVLGTNGRFGGRWIMTGDSVLHNLTVNNSSSSVQNEALMQQNVFNSQISMVDMTWNEDSTSRVGLQMIAPNAIPTENQTTARTLTLNNLKGLNGVFRVYTDIGAEQSDKLTTRSAEGHHIIQVYYNPQTFTKDLSGKYIVVAHVDDPQTTANFEGGDTEMGTQSYKTNLLKVTTPEGGFDWILGDMQNTGSSYGTKIIASILQSQYRSFAIQTETLNQRLGELKEINRIDGLWGRYTMGEKQTLESDVHVSLKDAFYSAWVGYDQNTLSLRGQNFLGFALSYALISPNGKDYIGNIHNVGFNFYDVFITENDFYIDVVAKYILSHGFYDVSYYSLEKNAPEYTNHKLMASLEIGKKIKLGNKRRNYFYLQPEAQIISGYIDGNELNFVDTTNTTIHANLSYTFPVIMRAGLTAAYAMQYGTFRGDFRLGSSLVYEANNGGKVKLDDSNSIVEYQYKGDFHLILQAGTNLILNDTARLYFEASTGFLGATTTNYTINTGVRFTFGPKNTRRLKIPSLTPPPPPPKPEYDPRNISVITDNTAMDIRNNQDARKMPLYDSDYFINTRKSFRDSTSLRR